MTNDDYTFSEWFDILKINVLEKTGVNFTDEESVIDDYEQGRDVYDVIDEIVEEYD
jgi:hypothetical protein